MFSLYHSLQKQFIILSHAVLVASNLAWSMHICLRLYRALPVGIRLDVTQHLCFQATIFGALSCFMHERLICEIMFTRWIMSNLSCKYHGAANAKIVEHWSNLGQYFPKKERKSRYKSNFQCVSLRRQIVCLWICHVTFLERTLRFGFLITLETLSFFSLKSSLEFIIITLHNMQKTRRSKERTNMDLHDNICQGSPIQFLTPPDRA